MNLPLAMAGRPGGPRVTWDMIVPSPESYFGAEDAITASTTQSQGQQPLTRRFNRIATCANANDAVTLPSAVEGLMCCVRNDGANTLQIFPASGDDINGGSADASITLAAGSQVVLGAMDDDSWYAFADEVVSGTYTPTLTEVANLDASTAYECQYMRVGNVVTVSGAVDVDPTTTSTTTKLGISLPVASNFANSLDCGGVGHAVLFAEGAAIYADGTNDRAEMQWLAGDVTDHAVFFTFTYQVI